MRLARPLALFAAAALLCACQRGAPPAAGPAPGGEAEGADARRIEADVRFLADDLLEGREAGTRGYDLAAAYVAQRYRALGLAPAGDDGSYFQRVPLLRGTREAQGNRLAVVRGGRRTELRWREQFLPAVNFDAAQAQVEAPAVFVGQGVHAPELGHDDFAGIDVRGKIAVLFNGAPKRFDDDRRAFHSSYREKLAALSERGAVGAVFVAGPEDEKRSPWARGAANWDKPAMRLRAGDGRGIDTFPRLRVVASVAHAAAEALFAGSGRRAAELFRALDQGRLRGFDLPGTLALSARTKIEPAESRNVVARLPGADPALAGEHVVFTAHLDHVGIGAPVNGDAIYNGALDNALGVAVMLEAAHRLAQAPRAPKRSILFVALTAEEKGLLGAEWFARHPAVPRGALVANVNMDMPVLLTPTRDAVPIGVEHSSLQAVLQRAARDVGVELSPDPFPEEAVFVRSDQYPFIRAGVPAVYLIGGVQGRDGDAKAALHGFLREHYHRPSDDADQPIQYADAARLARLNARIGELVADAPQRPAWNAGDFFGERFGKPAAAVPGGR